jgi:hypothetical protein
MVGCVDAAENWWAWLDRYGDDYATDEQRRAAYRDFKASLATMTERSRKHRRRKVSAENPSPG